MNPDVRSMLAWLDRRGTARNREGMARYGIRSSKAFGVSMATMRPLVKRLGRNHDLAVGLWESEWLEARILAGFIAYSIADRPGLKQGVRGGRTADQRRAGVV